MKIQPLHNSGVTGLTIRLSPASGQVRPVAIVDQPQYATSLLSNLTINALTRAQVDDGTHSLLDRTQGAASVISSPVSSSVMK
jgi:hypothetical protein